MNLPTAFSIGIKRYQQGATDAHGNTVASWAPPVFVGVYSIAPRASDEPFEPGREAVVTGLSVLAPKSVKIDRLDRVLVDGDEYTVEGEVADWSQGPFDWTPGLSINLERVGG